MIRIKSSIIEYLLIIALYYVTGGAFSYTNYSLQITIFFVVSFFLCVVMGRLDYVLQRRVILAWGSMSALVMLVPILFDDSITTYLAIVMQLAIGMFCAAIIPIEEFKKKYINVIVVFAAISLVGFMAGIIRPSIALRFPLTIGDASVDYYNAGVYVFMKAKGYSGLVLTSRNAGICWEPGCYQCFLNTGLFLLLEDNEHVQNKWFYFRFFVLLIAVITTGSTTGYFLLALILLFSFSNWSGKMHKAWIVIPILLAIFYYSFNYTGIGHFFLDKASREFGETRGFLDRISLDRIRYVFGDDGAFYFFGMSFAKWLTYHKSLWNSIIHSFLCLGTPFTILQLRGYRLGSRAIAKKWGLFFVLMIACASTETLFWRVFFNTITFYGWMGNWRSVLTRIRIRETKQ